jgi:mono/diheme cytochrome c family protein
MHTITAGLSAVVCDRVQGQLQFSTHCAVCDRVQGQRQFSTHCAVCDRVQGQRQFSTHCAPDACWFEASSG